MPQRVVPSSVRLPCFLEGRSTSTEATVMRAGPRLWWVASTMGYLRVVRVLLRLGARVSAADNDGATALHLSIVNKHLAVSKALVKAGADLEARIDHHQALGVGCTPLHVAAAKGFHKGMVMLIHAGVKGFVGAKANPILAAYDGESLPLDVAAENGQLGVVRELEQRFGIDGCSCDGGAQALVEAASQNQVDIVTFLFDNGVVDAEGIALCAAVEGRREECIELLLRTQGCNANAIARAYANMTHDTTLPMYSNQLFPDTPLVSAFELGGFYSPRITRLLLGAGADVASRVRYEGIEGDCVMHDTPLTIAESTLPLWETYGETSEDVEFGLKGVIRLLKQVDAVHATSWCWPSALEKSTPIVRMLPGLKRRATKPRVALAPLSRYNNKQDGPFLGYTPSKNGG
ncbi:unnamed protein product [Ectocarpus sp. CCAP 1310/34]|nr:unnamed protein product [Ectocarpus sp. CCAP 1310/34]